MNDGGLSDVVSMTPLSDIARIDILDDRDGRPRFIQLVDINGADVTSILNLPVNSDGEVEVQQVIDNSVFTNLEKMPVPQNLEGDTNPMNGEVEVIE